MVLKCLPAKKPVALPCFGLATGLSYK